MQEADRVLEVYSTAGCHLCEVAMAMLAAVAPFPIEVDVIDIAVSEALVAQYGTRIPVLVWGAHQLAWPFSAEELSVWLETHMAPGRDHPT